MPWPEERKKETRARIIRAAASAFRKHGLAQVGVADIMRQAGLTHGGFYAHFASKDALVADALVQAIAEVEEALSRSIKDDALEERLLSMVRAYLSPGHFAHPEHGCPLAALGPELTRCDGQVRRTLANGIRMRLKKLEELVSTKVPPGERRQRAAGALACMVGGLVVARGMTEAEALEFLKDCQAFLRTALADLAGQGPTPRQRQSPKTPD